MVRIFAPSNIARGEPLNDPSRDLSPHGRESVASAVDGSRLPPFREAWIRSRTPGNRLPEVLELSCTSFGFRNLELLLHVRLESRKS